MSQDIDGFSPGKLSGDFRLADECFSLSSTLLCLRLYSGVCLVRFSVSTWFRAGGEEIAGSTSATISETENLLSDFFSLPCCSARERETLLGLCFFVDSVIQWKFSASFSSEDWIAYTINWEIRGSNWSPIGCDIFSAAVEFLDPSLRASNWCSRSSPVVVNSGPETHDPEQKCCSVLFWF